MRSTIISLLAAMFVLVPAASFAGDIDSPGPPSSGSGMYTIGDIYNYLIDGTEPVISGVFREPAAGPGATMKSTKDIYDNTKAKFDSCVATPDKVLDGVTFFRTDPANWGPRAGTMENRGAITYTPTTTDQTVAAGYHNGSGKVEGDADLVAGKIKDDVVIFGVTGTFPNDGTATTGEVKTGSTFYTNTATKLTGNGTKTLSAANDTVNAGYYAATTLSGVDGDLTEANIVSGKTIFGKAGSAVAATGNAVEADVLAPKTFSKSGSAGLTGTMTNNAAVTYTPTTAEQTVAAGYHNGSGKVEGDANLVTGNIKSGVTIFGVAGKTEVVDTTEATNSVAAARMKTGDVGFVNGNKVTGTGTKELSDVNDNVAEGYYAGTTLSTVDTDLAAANIKKDVNIFGKVGTYPLAGVEKTGQTTSYGTGSDGDLQKGVAWPYPRFTNNGDGTVTDNLTGLMWAQNASADGTKTWSAALTYCNNLSLGPGGSKYTDWRLPNVKELSSLIDFAYYNPALSNDAGTAQWTSDEGSSFSGVRSKHYWSSTTYAADTADAWVVNLHYGAVRYYPKTNSYYVWPVRGGQ